MYELLFHQQLFRLFLKERTKNVVVNFFRRKVVRVLIFLIQYRRIPEVVNFHKDLIVSLTVKPSRLSKVHLVIKSILLQSIVPRKIILWIPRDEWPTDGLPHELEVLRSDRFMVRKIDVNLKSYNKIKPAIEEYPNSYIATADDDILYPPWWLDKLLKAYQENPKTVVGYRTFQMQWEGDDLTSYRSWKFGDNTKVSGRLLPTGVSGILYFPGCLNTDSFDSSQIEKLAPTADDLWLKVQLVKSGIGVRQVEKYAQHFPIIPDTQKSGLKKINKHANDLQLAALMEYFDLKKEDLAV